MKILRILRNALVMLMLVSPTGVLGADADLQKAQELMNQGRPRDAFALLDPLEDARAGDVEFDYLLGISALDSGRADRATLAFERVLAVNPNFAGARLDMARALFQLGDLPRARTEFETVLGQNPPDQARSVIAQYLDAIEKAEKAKNRRVSGYLEFAVGKDDNVNNSTSIGTINVPALGNLPFTLSPTNVKTGDNFKTLAGGIDFAYQMQPNFGFFAGADIRERWNFTQDRFNSANRDLRAGVAIGETSNQLRLRFDTGWADLDNRLSRTVNGISADWRYMINPANQLNAFSAYSRNRFTDPAVAVNSFDSTLSGVGLTHIVADGKGALFGSYFFGDERDTDHRADGAKVLDGFRLGGQAALREDLDLFAVASTQRGHYGRENATFLTLRSDDQNDVVIGMNWRFAKDWTLRPQVLQSKNKSNISIYEYKRTEFSVAVRYDFR